MSRPPGVEQRLAFLEFDSNTRARLREVRRIVSTKIDALLDRFYSHVLKQPELRNLFGETEAIETARRAEKRYWLETVLSGQRGPRYFDRAERVGKTHARIELTPNWYVGGYCYMLNQLVDVIAAEYKDDPETLADIVKALNKAAVLDMEIVIDSYLAEKDAAMREILRRVTAFAADAKNLQCDLRDAATGLQERLHALADRADTSKAETGRFRYEIKAATRLSHHEPPAPTVEPKMPDEISHQLEEATARIEALADGAADTATQAHDVLTRAGAMLEEIEKLNRRLAQLQFGDKLYYGEPPRKNFLTHLKGLVTGYV